MDRPAPPPAARMSRGRTTAARWPASWRAASRSPARWRRPICTAAAWRSRHRPTCCSIPTSTDFETKRGWPGMVARRARWRRRADRRHPSHLPAGRRLGQGAAGQEDARARRRRRGAAGADRRRTGGSASPRASRRRSRRRRSSACRPWRRSRRTGCGAGSGRTGTTHVTIFADAGRRRHAGRGHAGRPAEPRRHPLSHRRAAAWRRLQRRSAAWRDGRRLRRAAEPAVDSAPPTPATAEELRGGRRRADQPARSDAARQSAGPARHRSARPAARAPGAGGHQDRHRHRRLDPGEADRRAAPPR